MRSDMTLVIVLIECEFVRFVTELKTYCICKTVLCITKAVTHNLSETSNFIA
jgi:hypothetical protein